MIASMIPQIDFDVDAVRDVLEESFEWLAERFGSDHWKLSERQSRMLGKPTAELLSSLYGKLTAFLPEVIARWCESTPGAAGFILAAGIVVAPKVVQQVAISRSSRARSFEKAREVPTPIRPVAGPVGTGTVAQPATSSGPVS